MSTTSSTFNDAGRPQLVDAETYEPISPEVVVLRDPASPAAEQYRILRHRLEVLGRSGVKSLVFTSAEAGEGKTVTAVNAAVALGLGGRHKVVLVDGDLRRPHAHRLLGLQPREGLCDVVAGRATLAGTLWRFGSDQLYVLPAGNVPERRATTLYDTRLSEVFEELKQRFDFVLVDAPQVLLLADVPALCQRLDGALLVIRAGMTARELVRAALDALSGIAVHGLILNGLDAVRALDAHVPPAALPALPAAAG
jgi:capsular exopolysaccharide synthesis family protein